jgi:hypothetical protein
VNEEQISNPTPYKIVNEIGPIERSAEYRPPYKIVSDYFKEFRMPELIKFQTTSNEKDRSRDHKWFCILKE